MSKSFRKKAVSVAISAATVLTLSGVPIAAPVAFGQTVSDLTAQVNALLATITQLQSQIASLSGGSGATAVQCNFTRNLTVGVTGQDAQCLQQYLNGAGFTVATSGAGSPGNETTYFGNLTKNAVAAWQAANGVAPPAGYFGPISMAKYSSLVAGTVSPPPTTTTTTCPAGFTCTPTGSTGGVITTPGVEGTIVATKNPTPSSGTKVYEGSGTTDVLGIKLEAKVSDIRVERVKLQLSAGTTGNSDQQFYTKIANTIYVKDGSTILATMPLNSSTVVKEGSSYYITIAGFNMLVPKDGTKVLTVAIDPASSWDSTFNGDSWTLTVPADGVRGVDGAGINQYSPATGNTFNNSFTTPDELIEAASLAVSLNSGTPETSQVICEQGSDDDECDDLEVARFDFRSEKDDVEITDFVLDIVRGGTTTTATSTTAYLYDGTTLVGSATVVGTSATAMTATFSDIDWVIPADTTRTLIVKFDIDDAGLAATTFVASTDAADVTAENSVGTTVTATGSADGKTITVRNVGPELTLLSKSITTSGVPQSSATDTLSTSTLTASFKVRVTARGGDIYLGTVASTTGPIFSNLADTTNSFVLYANGVASSVSNATSTSFTIPTTCVTSLTNSCTLAEGASVDIDVTYLLPGRTAAGAGITSGLYAVELGKVNWAPTSTGAAQTTTFMAGLTDWRTSDVSFP